MRLASHQVEAVDWILESLRVRFGVLLCDDVGTGKSWVASMVARSMQRSGWAIETVVPAMLRDAWRTTLDAFEVDARLTSHEALRRRAVMPGNGMTLVIVDEAHRFRNPATAMHQALSRLAVGRRMLLVTATPVWNSRDDLTALLSFIAADDDLRGDGVASIDRASSDERLRARVVEHLVLRRDRDRCGLGRELASVATRIVRYPLDTREIGPAIGRLQFPLVASGARHELIRDVLLRRLASSDEALDETLRRQRRFHVRALEASREGLRLSRADFRAIYGDAEIDAPVQDLLFPQLWMEGDEVAGDLTGAIEAEIDAIDALRRVVGGATNGKLDRLRETIADIHGPAIVFASAIATARALFHDLGGTWSVGLLTSRDSRVGSARRVRAGTVIRAFRTGRVELLIATDCGAEGLDLQRAGCVVHYDLPWTAVRVRQRVGRANRIGQDRRVVESILFVPSGALGRSLARVLVRKARLDGDVVLAAHSARTVEEALLRLREAMPSALASGTPQIAMFNALAMENRLDEELARRLKRRYRPGVERIIREIASMPIDDRSVEELRALLELEDPEGVAPRSRERGAYNRA